MHPGCRWVRPVSLGSLRCFLTGFSVSLGSVECALGVAGLIVVRHGFHHGSLGSFGWALGVVGFVQGRWVHW